MQPRFSKKSVTRTPRSAKTRVDIFSDALFHPKVIIAIVSAVSVIIVALISSSPRQMHGSDTSISTNKQLSSSVPTQRLKGVVKDQNGNSLSGMQIRIQDQNEVLKTTDKDGVFVFDNLPLGDHVLALSPPSNRGQLLQHVQATNSVNQITIVYDAQSSLLGLLTVIAPTDDGIVGLSHIYDEYRSSIFGRCDGLAGILHNFDVWICLRSEEDNRFWIQHPPAVVDPTSGTWRADVIFGSKDKPPKDGEKWHIIAVAADSYSEIRRIENLVYLSSLPPHISGNVITVETKIKP